MEKNLTFSELVSQIVSLYKDIKYNRYQANLVFSKGKLGEYQKYQAKFLYQKRKLYSLNQKIVKMLNKEILEVKYLYGGVLKIEYTSGLTEDEVIKYLETKALLKNVELKILEIRKLPTINSQSFL